MFSEILYIYNLLYDKKNVQNILFWDLVYEKTFQLSSRTPQIPFNVLSRTRLLFLQLKLMSYIKFQNNCFKINA